MIQPADAGVETVAGALLQAWRNDTAVAGPTPPRATVQAALARPEWKMENRRDGGGLTAA